MGLPMWYTLENLCGLSMVCLITHTQNASCTTRINVTILAHRLYPTMYDQPFGFCDPSQPSRSWYLPDGIQNSARRAVSCVVFVVYDCHSVASDGMSTGNNTQRNLRVRTWSLASASSTRILGPHVVFDTCIDLAWLGWTCHDVTCPGPHNSPWVLRDASYRLAPPKPRTLL